jgi:hypothetical protein
VGEDTDISLAPYPLAPRGGRLARGTVIAIHSVDHSYFAFRDEKWGLAYASSSQVDLVPRDPREPAITPEKVRPLKDLTIVNLNEEPPPEEEPMEAIETGGESPAPPAPPKEMPGLVEPATVLTRVEPQYPIPRRAGIEDRRADGPMDAMEGDRRRGRAAAAGTLRRRGGRGAEVDLSPRARARRAGRFAQDGAHPLRARPAGRSLTESSTGFCERSLHADPGGL